MEQKKPTLRITEYDIPLGKPMTLTLRAGARVLSVRGRGQGAVVQVQQDESAEEIRRTLELVRRDGERLLATCVIDGCRCELVGQPAFREADRAACGLTDTGETPVPH